MLRFCGSAPIISVYYAQKPLQGSDFCSSWKSHDASWILLKSPWRHVNLRDLNSSFVGGEKDNLCSSMEIEGGPINLKNPNITRKKCVY